MEKRFDYFLDNFISFTDKEKDLIIQAFSKTNVKSKTELISLGKKSNTLFFILKGCIRKYCLKDGQQITIQIMTENQFAVEFVSFITEEVSRNTLETLEDCELLCLTKENLESLYSTVPKMNVLIRKVLEQVLLNTGNLLNDFIILSPEERYVKLIQNNPEILNRIPQHIIASNLGISATSLSRIRKRISK